MVKHSHKYGIISFILLLPFIFNLLTLKPGHNWGGDFSQYILHAQNILAQRDYAADIMLELPVLYPPGYPLILAAVINFSGIDFPVLKSLNVLFWYLSLIFLYPVFLKRLQPFQALLCLSLFSFSSFFFTFKQNLIADVPFLFFINAALYFFMRFSEDLEAGDKKGAALRAYTFFLITAGAAFLIRTAGVTLLLAGSFYAFVLLKKKAHGMGVLMILGLLYGAQTLFIGNHPGFLSDIFSNPAGFGGQILKHLGLSFSSVLWFFWHPQTSWARSVFENLRILLGYLSPVFCLIIFYHFIRAIKRGTLSFLGCFTFFYFLLLLLWSGFPHHPANFCRYTLPVLAPVLIYGIQSLCKPRPVMDRKIKKRLVFLANCVLVALLILNAANIGRAFDFNDDVLYLEQNQELFAWINKTLRPRQHYMIWQARPVALMTGRVGAVPWRYEPGKNVSLSQRVEDLKIDYIIATKGYDSGLIDLLKKNPHALEQVWQNRKYQIFQLRKGDGCSP